MPITDPRNVHVNRPLTDLSIAAFETAVGSYIGPRIAPLVPFKHLSDLYYSYQQADLLRIEMQRRASGAEADAAGYDLDTTAVTLERFALKKPTGWDEIHNQDEVLDLEVSDVDYLLMQWLLRMDERAVARLLTTGIWTGSTTGTDLVAADLVGAPAAGWATATSQPVRDVYRQRESIKLRSGAVKLVNQNFKLACGVDTWEVLKEHTDIESKYTGVQVGILTPQKVADAMDIGEIVVADTAQNTAAEGAAATIARLMDAQDACLLYVEPNPGKKKFSAAYTFVGGHRPGLSRLGHMLKTWDDNDTDAHITEINAYFRHAVIAANGGAYFDEVVS